MKKITYIAVLTVVILFCLCGCKGSESANANKNEKQEKEQTISSESIEETPTPKMDMDNPISELYSLEFTVGDEYNSYEISYHVPQINCDTDDAKKINDDIKEKYGNEVEAELASRDAGLDVDCEFVKWEQFICDGTTLALVVSKGYPGNYVVYDVYNFDGMTGKLISNEEILERVNLGDDEFVALVKEKAAKQYVEKYGDFKNMIRDDRLEQLEITAFYLERLEYTVSDEQVNVNMPMFINEEGGISVIASIGSMAGASSYYQILKIK